jgi:peptidoglycan hydrolase-like amidase
MNESEISFCFGSFYWDDTKSKLLQGNQKVRQIDGQIWLNGFPLIEEHIVFEPEEYNKSSFELTDVTIGHDFHWERKENQTFKGALEIRIDSGKLRAINIVSLEDYLVSVISSEMNATSNIELLKAHAVISRSWLMAQIEKSKELNQSSDNFFPPPAAPA